MTYFLKRTKPTKKGEYLQIYLSTYVPGKGSRNKCFRSLGYVSDLKEKGIEDPVREAEKEIEALNAQAREEPQIGEKSALKYAGHFLLKAMFDKLGLDSDINTMTSNKKLGFKMSDFLRTMVYAFVISSGSKATDYEKVIDSIYGCSSYTKEQIQEGNEVIGSDYPKYIECLNHHIEKVWKRDSSTHYLGFSNACNGNSLLRIGLTADKDSIPIGMIIFVGKEIGKDQQKKLAEEIKTRFDIEGEILDVTEEETSDAKSIEEDFQWIKSGIGTADKEETVYSLFLIGYYAVTLLRLLESKAFKHELSLEELVSFMQGYSLTETEEKNYVNSATTSKALLIIQNNISLSKLSNLYLKKKDVDGLFKTKIG